MNPLRSRSLFKVKVGPSFLGATADVNVLGAATTPKKHGKIVRCTLVHGNCHGIKHGKCNDPSVFLDGLEFLMFGFWYV